MTAYEQTEQSALPSYSPSPSPLNFLAVVGTAPGGASTQRDNPVQVSNLGTDLSILAAAVTTTFCDPLFEVNRQARALGDKLIAGAPPDHPSILHLLGVVMNGRTNDPVAMRQATMALNDVYLDGSPYRAKLNDEGVFSLVNTRTGQVTAYRFTTTTNARPR